MRPKKYPSEDLFILFCYTFLHTDTYVHTSSRITMHLPYNLDKHIVKYLMVNFPKIYIFCKYFNHMRQFFYSSSQFNYRKS